MRRTWMPNPGQLFGCQFEYPNPEPEPPPCGCEGWCDCEPSGWSPTLECLGPARVRVEFDDGRFFHCCSPEGHGVARVVWWGDLYLPLYPEGDWDRILKYVYRPSLIEELARREHPLFAAMRSIEVER